MTATERHLENVTLANLIEWQKSNAFMQFASSTSRSGLIELGVDGYSNFVVRINGERVLETQQPLKAIEKYKSLF